MIKTKKVPVDVIAEIQCDDCKVVVNVEDDPMEAQEFVSINLTGGFNSVFGDMSTVSLDLCQHCFKKRCGDVVRIQD